jgi:hypothetical protein
MEKILFFLCVPLLDVFGLVNAKASMRGTTWSLLLRAASSSLFYSEGNGVQGTPKNA